MTGYGLQAGIVLQSFQLMYAYPRAVHKQFSQYSSSGPQARKQVTSVYV